MHIPFRSFRDSTLRNKLILLIMIISGTVLMISSLLFYMYDALSFRTNLKNNLIIMADIIGNNAKPALLFSDEKAASESLSSISADDHILAAYIITPDLRVFARYISPSAEKLEMKLERPGQTSSNIVEQSAMDALYREAASFWDWDFDLDIVRDIQHNGTKIGILVIQSDTRELTARMLWFGTVMSAITCLIFVLVFFLSSRLQAVISRPILLVADAMKAVCAGEAGYSIRIVKESSDELGDLADGFNEMITRIQTYDQEVQIHRGHLEEEVSKRTYDLERAYDRITQELSERKLAEEALRLSENKLEEAQHIAHIGSWAWNLTDNSVTCSAEIYRIFQAEPGDHYVHHDALLRSICPEDLITRTDTLRDAIAQRAPYSIDYRIVLPDATFRYIREQANVYVDAENRPIQIRGTLQDITEHRRLEEQLRHAQKMEAVGQLAGGIAHDFNNILTAIIGYGNLVKMKMRPDDPLVDHVEQILASSERAANLTRSLLAFSRKQIMTLTPVDLNGLIGNVEKLLKRIIREDIELKTELADRKIPVLVDTVQIEQVMINLSTNARDAMPGGGTFIIRTDVIALSGKTSPPGLPLKDGNYALISVSDTGIGMHKKTQDRIFEPFFTTKEMGRGTGLGLAIIDGIIAQHNGGISVHSEPGQGTTFNIYLPLNESDTEGPAICKAEFMVPRGGSETILIAEDDEAVRRLCSSVLTEFGYHVLSVEDGEAAIRKFMENRDIIHLVILDMIMPKKNGKEVCDIIRASRPDIKILFASGYTADIIHKEGILDTQLDFLMKPLSPIDLLKKVREMLDR